MESAELPMLELGRMMREVYRVFSKRFEEYKPEGIKISMEQFSLLYAIFIKKEDVIQKDMAEMMGKDKSVILRMIDSLEEKELVRRVVDLKDRRKNYLMVTKAGERAIKQYEEVFSGLMKDIRKGLSQSEIDTFHKVVSHFKRTAESL